MCDGVSVYFCRKFKFLKIKKKTLPCYDNEEEDSHGGGINMVLGDLKQAFSQKRGIAQRMQMNY